MHQQNRIHMKHSAAFELNYRNIWTQQISNGATLADELKERKNTK